MERPLNEMREGNKKGGDCILTIQTTKTTCRSTESGNYASLLRDVVRLIDQYDQSA